MQRRNPPWQRDELILALDLYFRHDPSTISQSHTEVAKLSEVLKRLPIHSHRPDSMTFRNPNGVYMKLGNFRRFDPNYSGTGLTRGNRLEEGVWEDFSGDHARLRRIAKAIIEGVSRLATNPLEPEDDEHEFAEGAILYRLHRLRERDKSLVRRAKQRAEQNGDLYCSVCGFDFFKKYGQLGRGFIECHHTLPVSKYVEGQKTRLGDIALVCPNCHRMLHRRRPWLSISQLRQLLAESQQPDASMRT